jgi:hypothetical protein
VSNVPTEVVLTGTTAAPPPARALRAGPVRVLFTGGDLRQVRLGTRKASCAAARNGQSEEGPRP